MNEETGVESRFVERHPGSQRLYQRARQRFPGGVTHDNRYLRPFPVAFAEAQGCHKIDVDGHDYIDYVMGHGALLLGHSHPAVVQAVREQVARGTHLGGATALEVEWAELIGELVPSIERIRFHSSGTEASLMAIRLARAHTGRSKLLRFAGHYHGWHDAALATPASVRAAVPSRGITDAVLGDVVVVDQHDEAAVRDALGSRTVAAVIVEPTGAAMGRAPLAPEMLHMLRSVTEQTETVLIFDEVVTGFRITAGGAQRQLGITPDLTTLAKVVAGGLPGGAVGGGAGIMDLIGYEGDAVAGGRVGHPGTFNANPLSAAAGVTALRLVRDEPVNDRAEAAARRLCAGLRDALPAEAGVVYGDASLVFVALGIADDGQRQTLQAQGQRLLEAKSRAAATQLRLAMLDRGVDAMPGPSFIVSAVHTDADVDRSVEAFADALDATRLTASPATARL